MLIVSRLMGMPRSIDATDNENEFSLGNLGVQFAQNLRDAATVVCLEDLSEFAGNADGHIWVNGCEGFQCLDNAMR